MNIETIGKLFIRVQNDTFCLQGQNNSNAPKKEVEQSKYIRYLFHIKTPVKPTDRITKYYLFRFM